MSRLHALIAVVALVLCSIAHAADGTGEKREEKIADARADANFSAAIQPFFKTYCTDCHGDKKPEGNLSLAEIRPEFGEGRHGEHWQDVLRQLTLGKMPPADADQPTDESVQKVTQWITASLQAAGKEPEIFHKLRLPEYGNYLSHKRLFDGSITGPAFSPPRLWRESPKIYDRFLEGFGHDLRSATNIDQPFTVGDGKGVFADYAAMQIVDGATLQRLLLNCESIAKYQTTGIEREEKDPKDKTAVITRVHRQTIPEFQAIVVASNPPTTEQMQAAIRTEFRLMLSRDPDAEELPRYVGLMEAAIKKGGNAAGLQTALTAVMLRPDTLYRMEIGMGPTDKYGRRMLSPQELAFAVAYALTDKNPGQISMGTAEPAAKKGGKALPSQTTLLLLATDGKLSTREEVEAAVRRMLADKALPKPRLLEFFREFFGYQLAPSVFKGERIGREFAVDKLVKDADQLIEYILERDQNVFKELLTTDKYFVVYPGSKAAYDAIVERMTNSDGKNPKHETSKYLTHLQEKGWNPIPEANPTWRKYVKFYNFEEMSWDYPVEQPFAMPPGQRAGILTHPAWLVAWSGNFDNDPVRRGKWIREHLLAGAVPEVPITVNAVVPEDPHKSLRQRMQVTRDEYCWKCHQRMDPLGLAFEMYDDFGRFQQKQKLGDKSLLPVDATGAIIDSGDKKLDGDVKDAIELVHKLADSDLVRQSFVRHAFRYWLGRNETFNDAPTLLAADRAYVESGGSFQALVVSLLTSDSFLYRK